MINKTLAAMLAATAVVVAAPASAVTFNFINTAPATQTVGGIKVTATAWSTATADASSLPETATLGRYSPGFGVISGTDNPSSNEHTVDNDGRYDFIALSFSQAVQLNALSLEAFSLNGKTPDKDAWISYEELSANATIPGTWTTLLKNGFDATDGKLPASKGQFGNLWLIGAARTPSERNDAFKLRSIDVTAVPEPASWAMMIVGAGLVGTSLRRRKVTFGQAATA